MAEPKTKRWTVADVEALPYDEWHRYEIIDGELFVSTAPGNDHQYTCAQSIIALGNWNNETGLGVVLVGPGVIFSDTDAVQPDVVWVSREQLTAIEKNRHLHGAPELVIEVLSPGAANLRRDLEVKLRLYSQRGVKEYWAIDGRLETVRVYRPGTTGELVLAATLGRDETLTSPLLPGFALVIARLFRRG